MIYASSITDFIIVLEGIGLLEAEITPSFG